MSIRTRTVQSPGRVARRVQAAERVKSGAAQRAYAKRKTRAEQRADAGPRLPTRRSVMAARIPFVAAIIAMLGCGLALTLLLTTRAAEDSYQLGDARELNRKLSEERAALQREVESADSAPELAARARELGMIPAKDPARLVIGPDGTVTVIGKETPAQGPPVPPLNVTPSARPSPQPGHAQAQGERVVPVSTTPGRPSAEQANGNTPSPTPAAPAPGAVAVQPSPLPPPPAEVPQPAAQNPAAPQPAAQNPAADPAAPQPAAQEPAVAPDPAPQPVAQVPAGQQPAPPGAQVAPQVQPGGIR
ncbi:hypothetical protein ABZV58_33815 [Nocardia sp. NPDC004654]|uniref:hypothetical protein n=1 Tax=Nocardia sp. NPDC004654 TaxID=3154776 RepID=UPI0033B2B18D